MPRVHYVKKARKANPVAEVGESYYWWKSFRSPKRFSKTQPTRSMVTNSSFLSQVYEIEDSIIPNISNPEDLSDVINQIEEMMGETEDSLNNMPDHLQDVGTGEMLQNRISECECWIDELQEVINEFSDLMETPEDKVEERNDEFQERLNECDYKGE